MNIRSHSRYGSTPFCITFGRSHGSHLKTELIRCIRCFRNTPFRLFAVRIFDCRRNCRAGQSADCQSLHIRSRFIRGLSANMSHNINRMFTRCQPDIFHNGSVIGVSRCPVGGCLRKRRRFIEIPGEINRISAVYRSKNFQLVFQFFDMTRFIRFDRSRSAFIQNRSCFHFFDLRSFIFDKNHSENSVGIVTGRFLGHCNDVIIGTAQCQLEAAVSDIFDQPFPCSSIRYRRFRRIYRFTRCPFIDFNFQDANRYWKDLKNLVNKLIEQNNMDKENLLSLLSDCHYFFLSRFRKPWRHDEKINGNMRKILSNEQCIELD